MRQAGRVAADPSFGQPRGEGSYGHGKNVKKWEMFAAFSVSLPEGEIDDIL